MALLHICRAGHTLLSVGDATRRYWFGPRRIGFGWRPVTWEGWLVTIGGMVVVAAGTALVQDRAGQLASLGVLAIAIAVLVVLCIVKGTTNEADVRAQRPHRRVGVAASEDPSLADAVVRFDARSQGGSANGEPR